jgi:hypothetical protein
LIEQSLFHNEYFIKYVPVHLRPKNIMDSLYDPGAVYIATDFDHYESHFEEQILDSVEFELYSYMTQNLPQHSLFMSMLRKVLKGWNVCKFKNFFVKLLATRLSGEMNTSLGNGFTNLMLILYSFSKYNVHNPPGRVEGDDSLFRAYGHQYPKKEDFTMLGFSIKILVFQNLNEAAFCGMVFEPNTLDLLTDPIKKIINFSWFGEKYVNSSLKMLQQLLTAKSISLLVLYPSCPILTSLALYGIRVGHRFPRLSGTTYERETIRRRIAYYYSGKFRVGVITQDARTLMCKLYGFAVHEQLLLEEYLNNKTDLSPIEHPSLLPCVTQALKDYWQCYVTGLESNRLYPALRVLTNKDYGKRKVFEKEESTSKEEGCGQNDCCPKEESKKSPTWQQHQWYG